jgi:hypothetical protein
MRPSSASPPKSIPRVHLLLSARNNIHVMRMNPSWTYGELHRKCAPGYLAGKAAIVSLSPARSAALRTSSRRKWPRRFGCKDGPGSTGPLCWLLSRTSLGAGYNFNEHHSVIGEFMWNRLYENHSALANPVHGYNDVFSLTQLPI